MHRIEINKMSFLTKIWPLNKKKPTLFFIHGAGQSSIFWKAQITGLSQIANTIAMDLPGHGHSKEQELSNIEHYAEPIITLLNIVKPSFPIICGLSMGGAIAQYLLLTKPSFFEAAILINTGAKLKVLPDILNMIETNYNEYINTFIKCATSKKNRTKIVFDKITECFVSNPKITLNDFKACNNFNVMKTINSISVPSLVITADDDKLTPEKYGRYLAEQMTRSSYVSIIGAGHMSPIERPNTINTAIINFLRSIKFN